MTGRGPMRKPMLRIGPLNDQSNIPPRAGIAVKRRMIFPPGFSRSCRGMPALAAWLCATALPGIARAQLIQQNFPSNIPGYAPNLEASVLTHMSEEDQAEGVEIGDFIFRPQLSEAGGYDSEPINAPNTGSGEINSQASLRVNSDWGRDALGASFSVDNYHYLGLPVANYTNWVVGTGGALTLGDDTATLAYSHLAEHLGPQDLGAIGVITPVPYGVDDVRLSYEKLFSRFSITPAFEYQSYRFGTSAGALAINYDTLNHQIESGAVTGSYALAPGDAAIAIIRLSDAQFQIDPTDDYFDVGGFAGLDFRGNSLIQYRALVGYEVRSFRNISNGDISSPIFELDAVWTPTELDTVTVSGFREFSDPTSAFARNQIVTFGSLQLDYELRENVFLRATGQIGGSEPESNISAFGSQHQTQYGVGAAVLWNVNRNLLVRLSYSFLNNRYSNSNLTAAANDNHSSFTSNTIMLGFTLYE
jgi:hypothetical protein